MRNWQWKKRRVWHEREEIVNLAKVIAWIQTRVSNNIMLICLIISRSLKEEEAGKSSLATQQTSYLHVRLLFPLDFTQCSNMNMPFDGGFNSSIYSTCDYSKLSYMSICTPNIFFFPFKGPNSERMSIRKVYKKICHMHENWSYSTIIHDHQLAYESTCSTFSSFERI